MRANKPWPARAGAISTDGPDACYLHVPAQQATVSISVVSDSTATHARRPWRSPRMS
jgi:hypothetical protein